ncbi:MAG: lanthionine synthetase LanC family protein, partial [Bacteroidota bacterium]
MAGASGIDHKDHALAPGHKPCRVPLLPLVPHPRLGVLAKDIVLPAVDFLLYSHGFAERSERPEGPDWSLMPILMNADNHRVQFTNRLAYCYGDLNQLLVFVQAQRYLPEHADRYQNLIDQLQPRVCALRTTEETGIDDAHFCHGACGVAVIFDSLFRYTRDGAYQVAYQYWIEQTHRFLASDIAEAKYASKEASLLEGFSGIGLVLLSDQAEDHLPWPELFLLS